jgi:hypothetical protein
MIGLKKYLFFIFLSFIFSCEKSKSTTDTIDHLSKTNTQNSTIKKSIIYTDGFDFPVGKPNAKGYYNAQKFNVNNHLGDDWNGIKGGNSDLGDPIYSIANGYVSFAKDVKGGWGNVIRIVHHISDTKQVESLYAHCDTLLIKDSQYVKKGQQIATIGTANGVYIAHLHLEIRTDINLPLGAGYSTNTTGYVNPTEFIKTHR